jgi:cysteine-rich repeat protein
MFNKDEKNKETEKQNLAQSASVCRVPQIYIMPQRFLSAAAQKIRVKKKRKRDKQKIKHGRPSHKSTKKRLIHPAILALVILIVGGLGTVVVYLLLNKEKPPVVSNANSVVRNVNKNINQNRPINKNTNVNQNINQAQPVCGDGKVDASNNEQCDDGNRVAGDGCSTSCRIEPPRIEKLVDFTSYPTTIDTDEDFLTDTEEQLYGTGVNNMDEDGDTYLDGLELINLYNPKGKTPSQISDSDLINVFNNQDQGYSIFYPKGWNVRYLSDDKSEVIFESSTVEFIEVLVTDNFQRQSISAWAKKQFSGIDVSKLERVGVGDKLGIRSPNGLTVNFTNEDKIYSVTYQIGTLRRLNFKATFQMMYNSLKLYSRNNGTDIIPVQWSSYVNNQIGVQLQHPANLEITTGENNLIMIDDFSLQFFDNQDELELNEWFSQNYDQEANKDCQIRTSELKIGRFNTFLIDKPVNLDEDQACDDSSYYALSNNKKRVIKLTIGNNPVREMAQILSTLQFINVEL